MEYYTRYGVEVNPLGLAYLACNNGRWPLTGSLNNRRVPEGPVSDRPVACIPWSRLQGNHPDIRGLLFHIFGLYLALRYFHLRVSCNVSKFQPSNQNPFATPPRRSPLRQLIGLNGRQFLPTTKYDRISPRSWTMPPVPIRHPLAHARFQLCRLPATLTR